MYTLITCLFAFVGKNAFGQKEILCEEPKDFRLIEEGEFKKHHEKGYINFIYYTNLNRIGISSKSPFGKRQTRISNACN